MTVKHYNATPEFEQTIDLLNDIFNLIFNVEAVIKLFALGVKQ